MKKHVNVWDYAGHIMEHIGGGILLTTKAGDKVNTMTIGWGTVGVQWGKPIFIAFVRESRHTKKLVDKTGAEFPVIRDGNTCRSVVLNGKKLSWLDRQEDLQRLGVWATRLYFTTENATEVDRVLSAYVHADPFDPGACTRGLYLRGVE